ncbi:MAG: hypothetical protein OEU86_05695 [Gammaproteobacteria bacterium]|nr:hypothetical protein [Gammaproteobacteria bacterium]
MLVQSSVTQSMMTVTQTTQASPAQKTVAEEVMAPELEGESTDKEKMPGVLRHLQAGKFQGTADVRLRLVFQEQLAAMAEDQAKDRAPEASATLVSNIAAEITGFMTPADPVDAEAVELGAAPAEVQESANIETAMTEFENAVSAATTSLVEGEGLELQTYETAMQTAFSSLVEQLEVALTEDAGTLEPALLATITEPAVLAEDTIEVADVNTDATHVTAFLEGLSDMFTQELAGLLESAERQDILPPLNEPAGNGKAFDKFKALYEGLSASDSAMDDSPQIDVQV